jgi:large subunit ribosomal protein L15
MITKTKKNKPKIKKSKLIEAKRKQFTLKKKKLPKVELEKPRLVGLETLRRPPGANTRRKMLGRGPGSGHGKTSTRGHKGQTSRPGRHFYLGFEGAQIPLIKRIPKRGFSNTRFKIRYQIVNLKDLNTIKDPTIIDPKFLAEKGFIKSKADLIKILGSGEIAVSLEVKAHAFSRSAREKIEKAGGKIEIINVNA